MKKNLLILFLFTLVTNYSYGQLLYDNGPLITDPGAGAGGADVSAANANLKVIYGFNQNRAAFFRVSDEFTITDPSGWAIDSIVFFGYQTNSGTTSSFTDCNLQIWDGSPDNVVSSVIYGDTFTTALNNTYWSGTYRTSVTTLTSVARPVMKNAILTPGLILQAGTFWLDWGAYGSSSFSGPWVPPITYSNTAQTITGNAIQLTQGITWQAIVDTNATDTTQLDAQGLPFLIYGSVLNGIKNHTISKIQTLVNPNPVQTSARIQIADGRKGGTYSFVVYDATGREVLHLNPLRDRIFEIQRGNIASGLYAFKVLKDGHFISNGKLIFE